MENVWVHVTRKLIIIIESMKLNPLFFPNLISELNVTPE